jgi:hypothetical protein
MLDIVKAMKNIASAVLMVAPTTFGFDSQTAQTNGFQKQLALDQTTIRELARREYEVCVESLRAHGVTVVTFDYGAQENVPNAVFPNNWITTWPDGRVYTYPMATESRRRERSQLALEALGETFQIANVVDLSSYEATNQYLEGTGVMVFDHHNRVAYGCVSPRLDRALFEEHTLALGYTPVVFRAYDTAGAAIYHTNVLMGVQARTAVVCTEAIDPADRSVVLDLLRSTGHEVIKLSYRQMGEYCGNIIQLQGSNSHTVLLVSESAWTAFTAKQQAILEQDSIIIKVPIPTIQAIGGGSVRCMVAEIFLQPVKVLA